VLVVGEEEGDVVLGGAGDGDGGGGGEKERKREEAASETS
jgi:hypothetical protein